MKHLLLIFLLLGLLAACGSDDDNNANNVRTNPALQCNPNTFANQGSIYNTNGYCLNGQIVQTNQFGQAGFVNPYGPWVPAGPYTQPFPGQYQLCNPQINPYCFQNNFYYRFPNHNGWNYQQFYQ